MTALLLVGIILLMGLTYLLYARPYLVKAVRMSLRSGRPGPAIDEMHAFHNRRVGKGDPSPWPRHARYNVRSLSSTYLKEAERLGMTAFVVIHQGALLQEVYVAPSDEKTLTNSFSMAKSIVAILIGHLQYDGRLDLDDPVAKHLPEFSRTTHRKITIRHLLQMSSGLTWVESEGSPFSHNAEAYYGRDLTKLVLGLSAKRPPGEVYRYVSGNTQLLALIIQRLTGRHLSEVASEVLWQAIGAEQDAFWNLDRKEGVEKAFCCFYATARDFARVGQLYLNGGIWGDRRIVTEDYVRDCLTPSGLHDVWRNKVTDHYGLHWWITQHGGRRYYYARGIRGQYIIFNPELDVVIVRLGHYRSPVDRETGHPPDLYGHIDAALALLSDWSVKRARASW